jgi:hypothetical protein
MNMVDRTKEAKRVLAEERFTKAQARESETRNLIETERALVRKKTERLKALRLAKEASEGLSEIDKKPVKKRAKAKQR